MLNEILISVNEPSRAGRPGVRRAYLRARDGPAAWPRPSLERNTEPMVLQRVSKKTFEDIGRDRPSLDDT